MERKIICSYMSFNMCQTYYKCFIYDYITLCIYKQIDFLEYYNV